MNRTDDKRKFTIHKKLVFAADSPVVRVEYRYENRSDTNIFGFDIGVRNFLYPAGKGGITERDRYIFPSTHGTRRIIGYKKKEESGRPMPELGHKLVRGIGAPWHGLMNLDNQSGIAVSHEDDYYDGWYVWKAEVEFSTYEWTFKDLPAGHSRCTVVNLIQVDNLPGLCFASSELLAAGNPSVEGNKLKYDLTFKPLAVTDGEFELRLTVRNVTGAWSGKPEKRQFKAEQYKNTGIPFACELPGDGLYEIRAEIIQRKQCVAEWVESVPVGEKVRTLPLYAIKYRGGTENLLIPGWSAPPAPVFQGKDKNCGFAVCAPLKDNVYHGMEKLEFDIAANEYESHEIVIFPNRSKSTVSAELDGVSGGIPARLRYQDMVRIDGANSGLNALYGKILRDGGRVSGEEPHSFWLTVGGGRMKPGRYAFAIRFKNTAGDTVRMPCR
jgi:hypothetical protein